MSKDFGSALFVAGLKQSLKMITSQKAKKVYLAADADFYISSKISDACIETGTDIEVSFSKAELGKLCKIEVDAAVVAVLK